MPTRTRQSRRRLVRPASKQILQLRGRDDGAGPYDGSGGSPYSCGSSSWSSPAEDARSPRGMPADGDEDAAVAAVDDDACGLRVHSSSSPHERHRRPQARRQRSDTWQRAPHDASQRAMTASACRGGKCGRKSNDHGPRSASSRDYTTSSRQRQQQQQRPTTSSAAAVAPHPSRTKRASPVMAGGHVTYYGPPPATALVVSPAQLSPSSMNAASPLSSSWPSRTDGATNPVAVARGKTRCSATVKGRRGESHGRAGGDTTTTPSASPGAAASTTITTATTDMVLRNGSTDPLSASRSACSTCDATHSAASASASSSDHRGSSPEAVHRSPATTTATTAAVSAVHTLPNCGCTRAGTAATAVSPTASTSTSRSSPQKQQSKDTPLTYAAVACASSASGLHGKRLPQSRVGFGNYRRRVGGGSGTASVGSTTTTRSTTHTPATAVGSPALFTESHVQSSYSTRGYCASSCGFPSVPQTPLTCTNLSYGTALSANGSVSRAPGKDSPSTPQLEDEDDADGGDVKDEEGESDGEGAGAAASKTAAASASPHASEHAQHQPMMPPIPPSRHRHHPTNLFLQLPDQHRPSPDSDEEEAATWLSQRHEQQAAAAAQANPDDGAAAAPRPPSPTTSTPAHPHTPHQAGTDNNTNGGDDAHTATAAATDHAASLSVSAGAAPTATAQRQQSAIIQEELSRCKTSSTMKHTGSAVAARAAARLHLLPIATTTALASSATPSTSDTPIEPTLQKQQPQQQQRQQSPRIEATLKSTTDGLPHYHRAGGGTPPLVTAAAATANGSCTHKVSSPAAATSFFSAAEIFPGLFLGSYADSTDTTALAAHDISLVINCALECAVTSAMASNTQHVRYVQFPLRDHSDEAIASFFAPVTQLIHEQLHRRQINQQRTTTATMTAATPSTAVHAAHTRLLRPVGKSGEKEEEEAVHDDGVRDAKMCYAATYGFTGTAAASYSLADEEDKRAGGGGANEADAYDTHGALHDRMRWTWADEADNVWAVPTSPASPPLSVGGQPSLKEGKRETPRSPSPASTAAAATGAWGGRNSEGSTSLCTSGSPSPLPGRTATFPGVSAGSAVAAAATPTGSVDLLTSAQVRGPAATGLTTVPAFGADDTENINAADHYNRSNHNIHRSSNSACLGGGVNGSSSAAAPLTVVDPRDCGGILVHCRMGVSRSAAFVMAYLILYGYTLANLEDTASLFVGFLEREKRVVEETGGRAFFGYDANGASAATGQAPSTSNNNAPRRNTTSLTQINSSSSGGGDNNSRVSASVSSPTGSGNGDAAVAAAAAVTSPASTSFGVRRPVSGFAARYAQRNSSLNSNNNIIISSSSNGNGTPQPSPLSGYTTSNSAFAPFAVNRRSAIIPINSPLCQGGFGAASPRSTTSSSMLRLYTPLTPLEICSRVCRPCYLQRMRERRLQQQVKNLRINGQQQQQQRREQEQEEEEQVMALAAITRTRNEQQQQQLASADRNRLSASSLAEDGRRCVDCGDDLLSSISVSRNTNNRSSGCRFCDTMTQRCSFEEHEQQRQRLALRPTPSSAPVVSYRGARGSYGVGQTLLEAALADDDVENRQEPEEMENNAASTTAEEGGKDEDENADEERRAAPCVTAPDATPLRSAFSVSNTSAVAAAQEDREEEGQDDAARKYVGGCQSAAPQLDGTRQSPTGTPHYGDFPSMTSGSRASAGLQRYKVAPAKTSNSSSSNNNNTNGIRHGTLLRGSCDSSSVTSSHSMLSGDLAPAMTFREAFDAVKKQKSDVNPNIGFVLALRELAGGGDFSFSASF
ncbi:phophatase-like protein [Leptomonas pyrrhocoris]|uniref:Phophatase-like protein n=1 Tax=Leptomonas pyrrhocoris TaxID=157538 RepID=A0A0M9G2E3_LEPPY|nr:phophatase-like protein [Leptomonas pyrrhocoris]KPA80853.1 phophatase-like protein [Leptomonas pyrrhocoris]|eukprot:XP_015659292.1 phophatase-like protein [Leptomonas pyrrhocoris]